VNSLRILAVAATPAEAAPGTMTSYSALVVGDQAAMAQNSVDWAFCNLEKPLSDLNDVDEHCFTGYTATTPFLVEIGLGPYAQGKLPTTGCSLFGPDVPPAMPMMPPGRPSDPDLTGGYYQPVRLILEYQGATVLAAEESRIQCGLPGATSDTLAQFKMEYKPNQNPAIAGIAAVIDGTPSPIGMGGTASVGGAFTLRVSWQACPSTSGCGSETYPYFDPLSQMITMRREAMSVAWYATDGSFASDTTGRTETDEATYLDNTWTAPATAETVTFWVVLRDSRGGVTWAEFSLDVK
jgi:hypothetical protein